MPEDKQGVLLASAGKDVTFDPLIKLWQFIYPLSPSISFLPANFIWVHLYFHRVFQKHLTRHEFFNFYSVSAKILFIFKLLRVKYMQY